MKDPAYRLCTTRQRIIRVNALPLCSDKDCPACTQFSISLIRL